MLYHEILYTCYRQSTDLTFNCQTANTKRKEKIVTRFSVGKCIKANQLPMQNIAILNANINLKNKNWGQTNINQFGCSELSSSFGRLCSL